MDVKTAKHGLFELFGMFVSMSDHQTIVSLLKVRHVMGAIINLLMRLSFVINITLYNLAGIIFTFWSKKVKSVFLKYI